MHGVPLHDLGVEIDRALCGAMHDASQPIVFIHGIGTGTLRDAVHEELRCNPLVLRFELSFDGGATVVWLHN